MEYLQPCSFFPALFCLFVFIFILRKITKSSKKSPPGPWKLPIIGNMHQLLGGPPHRRLAELSNIHGPVMHLKLGEVSNVIISSPEAAKQVMKTHDLIFAQRPYLLAGEILLYNFQDIGFAPFGESWRQMRKICTLELLSAKRVKTFQAAREEETSKLVKTIFNLQEVNFSRMVFSISNAITFRSAFGKMRELDDAFLPLAHKMSLMVEGFNIVDVFPSLKFLQGITGMRSKLQKLHQEVDHVLENIINEHRKNKKLGKKEKEEDLVDVLLNIQEQNNLGFSLATDNIKAVMLDMFLAGTDTVSTTIEWAMSEMMKNPRVLQKAQAEIRQVFNGKKNIDEAGIQELKYLKLVIKEALRLHPPAPLLVPRECMETAEIDGYEVKANTKVIVNAWAIGRDKSYWTEAERFNPERFESSSIDFKGNDFEYIPFGAGRRMCPGMLFGLAIVEMVLTNLLYHFDWKLAKGTEPENLDMYESFGISARRKHELYLIPTPYNGSP